MAVGRQDENPHPVARKSVSDKGGATSPFHMHYFGWGRLAGGMIPFIRRYSTIWP